MRSHRSKRLAWMTAASRLATAAALALATAAVPAQEGPPRDVLAGPPSDVSVTVYRAPQRREGAIDIDDLRGFALVSETRAVHLPAGESRLRFEDVADGIETVSAILSGLGDGVLEKNRDAALLSPRALLAAAVGKTLLLTRAHRRSGKIERLDATVLSAADGGVTLRTAQGIEGLRCSGLPETFLFEGATGLGSHPALSVLVRTVKPAASSVTLTYLARGFDWTATYGATLADDEKHMDLGAWVTLANGNGVGFPGARAQVVAGRVNRENGAVEPLDLGGPILALCWPLGSTSDVPPAVLQRKLEPVMRSFAVNAVTEAMAAPAPMAVSAQHVTLEQLGDLKLYRVPERTTIASRQSKQIRLLDRAAIPIHVVYLGEDGGSDAYQAATKVLRTRNDQANHLGLPLPSGRVSVYSLHDSSMLLQHESDLRDLGVGEDVEIDMGRAPDVEFKATRSGNEHEIDVTNARDRAVEFELALRLADGTRLGSASSPIERKNGRPLFRLTIPPRSSASIRYATAPPLR